jgi:transcription antitermination factor NusG
MDRTEISAADVEDILAAQRLRRQLTDKALAHKYGVSINTIKKVLEKGRAEAHSLVRSQFTKLRPGDAMRVDGGEYDGFLGNVIALHSNTVEANLLIDGGGFTARVASRNARPLDEPLPTTRKK